MLPSTRAALGLAVLAAAGGIIAAAMGAPLAPLGGLLAAAVMGFGVAGPEQRAGIVAVGAFALPAVLAGAPAWAAAPLVVATSLGRAGAPVSAALAELLVPGAGRVGALVGLVQAPDRRGAAWAAGALAAAVALGFLLEAPVDAGLDALDTGPGRGARLLLLAGLGVALLGVQSGAWVAARAGAAVLLALGPTLILAGEAPVVAGRLVPLPALLLTAVPGLAAAWSLAALAPAARTTAPASRPLLGLFVAVLAGGLTFGPPVGAPGPPSLRIVDAAPGAVLVLPRARAPSPLGPVSPQYGDPLLVAALGVLEPDLGVAVPPGRPGAALASDGVTAVVVARDAVSPEARVVLDGLLRGALGPPVRDLREATDLYRVDVPPEPGVVDRLRTTGPDLPPGWLSLDAWMDAQGR